MKPKETALKDRYSVVDLKKAKKVLTKQKAGKETVFQSGDELLNFFKERTKK